MSDSPSPVRASAQEQAAAGLFASIQSRLNLVKSMHLPKHSPAEIVAVADCIAYIAEALTRTDTAAEARGRQQAEQERQPEYDEEFVPHAFTSRTPYEPGDDRDIWCKECEYHRDHQIHQKPLAERVQQAEQARDEAQRELETWRRWAQFVYLGGGPVTLSDQKQRMAICTAHDAQVEGLQASEIALMQALKDYGQHKEGCPAMLKLTEKRTASMGCLCGFDAALTGAQA